MQADVETIMQHIVTASNILVNRQICEAFGHVSARIPGTDKFLITPRSSLSFVENTEDLVTVDLKGDHIKGKNEMPLETWLHTCIYRERNDVGGIVRAHSFTTSVFSILGKSVKPVHDFGAILLGEIPVFDDSHLIENEPIGKRLAGFIGGEGTGALLRGNGTAILGKDVVEAVVRTIYLEESAMLQHKALQIGEPIYFSQKETVKRGTQLLESSHVQRAWEHYRREAALI